MIKLLVSFLVISVTLINAQFKYSASMGLGATFGIDIDEFNTSISDSGLKEIDNNWIPFESNISVQVYPSIRLGYFKLSNALIPNESSEDFILVMVMQGVSIESFFTFQKRFEANFGMVPLLGKAKFAQKFTAKTSPFQFSTTTQAGTENSTFGFYSWVGLRLYLLSFVALEGNMGYIRAKFKDDNWKSKGGGSGVSGKINLSRPFFMFGIVFGW